MDLPPVDTPRFAAAAQAATVAELLDVFNREYDTPTPGTAVLVDRSGWNSASMASQSRTVSSAKPSQVPSGSTRELAIRPKSEQAALFRCRPLNGTTARSSTAANRLLNRGGSRPEIRTSRSGATAMMYPNSMWNSSCSFVHRVPALRRRRSHGPAVPSRSWKVSRARSSSSVTASRSKVGVTGIDHAPLVR
jgi:hypothetical protein